MKGRLFLIALLSAALLFAGCKKGIETAVDTEPNTLYSAGKLHQLVSSYTFNKELYSNTTSHSTETNSEGNYSIRINVSLDSNCLNHTFDISKFQDDITYTIAIDNGDNKSVMSIANISYDYFLGSIGNHKTQGSPYQSGTMTITKNDTYFSLIVKGVLKNGYALCFHLYVPADQWEYDDLI
jgi:hypothetical protein